MQVEHLHHVATHLTFEEALRRARADFREMPGLRLTVNQAKRLWTLYQETCATVLSALVASGFLSRSGQDAFVARRLD